MFETPMSIKQIMNGINNKYYLPGIQREFVWKEEQIVNLFDSILRGYPIGSFLFWRVNQENMSKFTFYDFIKDFHQVRNKHNQKNELQGKYEIEAILDGQQRLTSLFIGLKGSLTTKKPYMSWDNPKSFPKRKLYLNLSKLKQTDDIENSYIFEFRENSIDDKNEHWFEVGKILDFEFPDVNKYVNERQLGEIGVNILSILFQRINIDSNINYYLEKSDDLHKVLNIFVRVNSGGTKLSYSDLLLSILTSNFKDIDIREEMFEFVDNVNNLGNGFSIDKDFVLKTALFLLDKDVKFKVDNFDVNTIAKIEEKFERVKDCIYTSYQLLSHYGFNSQTLTSNYPTTIITYYLYKKDINLERFLTHKDYQSLREKIRMFVIKTLLMSTFSSSLDTVLSSIRKAIQIREKNEENKEIIVDYEIDISKIDKSLPMNKKLDFTDETIEELLYSKYGNKRTFLVLSLLYPNLDLKNYFHVDHIYPKSKFNKNTLKSFLDEEKIGVWKDWSNYIGNLQLLEGKENMSKNDSLPEEWLNYIYDNNMSRKKEYREKNYINPELELTWDNFETFFEEREQRLIKKLRNILQ